MYADLERDNDSSRWESSVPDLRDKLSRSDRTRKRISCLGSSSGTTKAAQRCCLPLGCLLDGQPCKAAHGASACKPKVLGRDIRGVLGANRLAEELQSYVNITQVLRSRNFSTQIMDRHEGALDVRKPQVDLQLPSIICSKQLSSALCVCSLLCKQAKPKALQGQHAGDEDADG